MCNNRKTEKTAEYCPTDALIAYGKEYESAELADILTKDMEFFKNSNGRVTLSGGECPAQPDFAVDLAKKLCDRGVSVFVDTCGYAGYDVFEKIIPYTDKFLYDIKAVDADVHKKCMGKDNTLILQNLKRLSENNCQIEIRYPLVMGYNDKECDGIGKVLSGFGGITKVKVLQYHPFVASRYKALDIANTLPHIETTFHDVENAVKILKSYGLNAVNGITES